MTGAAAGLRSEEAARRLAEVGPNDPAPLRRSSIAIDLLRLFLNPLVLLLLAASAVSAFLGEPTNALIICVMVVLSVALNFVQAYRSDRAARRLRAGIAPTATALRDGRFIEIPRADIVPGDVVRLSAGDLVPADARLLESRDLHVQQAALTGESLPVEKFVAGDGGAPSAESPGSVLLGSSVVSGIATALVVATGARTAFGDIAARLAAKPPQTEFDRGLKQFGFLIMETVLFLVLFLVIVSIALHRDPLESLLFAVALAVGLTPEFLPMITTVTLSRGAVAMAHERVIVKHLSAIQDLGSIDVLCSDKTGTLTGGEMKLDASVDPLGRPSPEPLRLAYLNSAFETGIRSPLDLAILAYPEDAAAGYEKTDEIPFDFRAPAALGRARPRARPPPRHQGRAGGGARGVRSLE